MRRWCGVGVLSAACAGAGPEVGPCEPADGVPALEIGQQLAVDGPMHDGDPVSYGIPPQGGAPYAPFELRLQAELVEPTARVVSSGEAVERSTGEVIGSVEQTQAFFCSNTGVHEGWLYGGELHLRFWDEPLEALEGREIEVRVRVELLDGELVEAGAVGTLRAPL
jgi:hypothetical protein